jgi:hypothetical protein
MKMGWQIRIAVCISSNFFNLLTDAIKVNQISLDNHEKRYMRQRLYYFTPLIKRTVLERAHLPKW